MVHAEDHARAYTGSARNSEMTAVSGNNAIGSHSRGDGEDALRPAALSVVTVLRAAEHADDMVGERVKAVFFFAERAENIATRLAGPYPGPGPSAPPVGRDPEGEGSGFGAMQAAIAAVSRRAASVDPAFARLSAALDWIESTLG